VRSDILIAGVIALAGAMAIGQAVNQGLTDSPRTVTDVQSGPHCPISLPPVQHDRKISFAAVGDTVTDWGGGSNPDPTSWVRYVGHGGVRFDGGYAQSATRTQVLAARAPTVHSDVLVVMTGTTDLRYGYDSDQLELDLQRLVDRTGAGHVLLSSIPPVRGLIDATVQLNEFLSRVAYRHGWSFVDAGSAVRGKDCRYRSGMSNDGIRPTPEGARLIGDAVRAALTGRLEFTRPAGS
jgi:lysophospholipase L1-like esterase